MRTKVFVGLLLAAFITGLIFVAAPVKAAELIKIGAILPLSDATGKDGIRSMQMAVKEINGLSRKWVRHYFSYGVLCQPSTLPG